MSQLHVMSAGHFREKLRLLLLGFLCLKPFYKSHNKIRHVTQSYQYSLYNSVGLRTMDRNETRDCIEMRIYTNADLRKLLG